MFVNHSVFDTLGWLAALNHTNTGRQIFGKKTTNCCTKAARFNQKKKKLNKIKKCQGWWNPQSLGTDYQKQMAKNLQWQQTHQHSHETGMQQLKKKNKITFLGALRASFEPAGSKRESCINAELLPSRYLCFQTRLEETPHRGSLCSWVFQSHQQQRAAAPQTFIFPKILD